VQRGISGVHQPLQIDTSLVKSGEAQSEAQIAESALAQKLAASTPRRSEWHARNCFIFQPTDYTQLI